MRNSTPNNEVSTVVKTKTIYIQTSIHRSKDKIFGIVSTVVNKIKYKSIAGMGEAGERG